MGKYKVSIKNNIISVRRASMRKLPVNERELRVFDENLMTGLFHPKIDGKHRLIYTAPLSISLYKYVKKGLTVHKYYNILAQVAEMTKKIDIYKLYLHNLVLDADMIFVKEITGELFFLYEPIINRETSTNVYAFLCDFIQKIKTEEKELESERKETLNFLEHPGNYKIEDLESFIVKAYPQIYQQITRADAGKSGFITSNRLSYGQHYDTIPGESGVTRGQSAMEEGTTFLQDEEGTSLLMENSGIQNSKLPAALLIRRKTKEKYYVNGNAYHIGKETDNHLYLSDNSAISRRHATIAYENGHFALTDEGSLNHTYLNERMLQPHCMELLQNSDVIRFANDEFDFYLN